MKKYLPLVLMMVMTPAMLPAAEGRYIVRTNEGLPALQLACRVASCNVIRSLDGTLGRLFLITTPIQIPINLLNQVLQLVGRIVSVELDRTISIGETPKLGPIPAGLLDRRPVDYFGTTVWNGYASQPAAHIVRLPEAQARFSTRGGGVVAIIDTGIDPNHPALRSVAVRGYDFLSNKAGSADETEGIVQQSTAAVLDGGGRPGLVNDAVAAVLSLPLLSFLSGPSYEAFGHGTMVAGMIHLAAPRTSLLPLRAFKSDGTGFLSDILRAIYFAAGTDAKVINMSFSFPSYSAELALAMQHCFRQGVVVVASAGNNGNNQPVYPAALPGVIGVASTDYFDRRSSFSNYGSPLVWVAAPGEQIITTYPLGTYSSASGTSFSAPLVTGTVALLLDGRSSLNQTQARDAVAHAQRLSADLGNGRLDIPNALQAWFGGR